MRSTVSTTRNKEATIFCKTRLPGKLKRRWVNNIEIDSDQGQEENNLSLYILHRVHIRPNLLPNGNRGLFPCGQKCWVVKLATPFYTEVKNERSYISTSPYVIVARCLTKRRYNLPLYIRKRTVLIWLRL
jgi:hypothetical protein